MLEAYILHALRENNFRTFNLPTAAILILIVLTAHTLGLTSPAPSPSGVVELLHTSSDSTTQLLGLERDAEEPLKSQQSCPIGYTNVKAIFGKTKQQQQKQTNTKLDILEILSTSVVVFTDYHMVTLLCYDQLPVLLYLLIRAVGTVLWVALLLLVLRKGQPWNN